MNLHVLVAAAVATDEATTRDAASSLERAPKAS
jgi:hypothetical protein